MFSKKLRNLKGFTLVELIIVIVIIGILSATILPKIVGAPAAARDRGRISELNNLEAALQMYFNDNGLYPSSTGGDCLAPNSTVGTLLVNGNYLMKSTFPRDPVASNQTGGECTAAQGTGDTQRGYFFYKSLTSMTIPDASFMLIADVENDGQANSDYDAAFQALTSRETVDDEIDNGPASATGTAAVYVKLGT